MATTLIGTPTSITYWHSIINTQSGINIESLSHGTEPEFREKLLDISGHVTGQAIGGTVSTITISGEVIRASSALQGLLAEDFVTESSIVLTSSDGLDGATSEFVAQNADITQTRGSFETCSITYVSLPNLAIA